MGSASGSGKAPVVRAALSPVGLGVGAVSAIIGGLVLGSVGGGIAVGVVLYLIIGLVTLLRAGARPRTALPGGASSTRGIDPFTLGEPWRFFVRDALQAQTRFRQVVAKAPSGPIRERLAEIGQRLDEGVAQVWATAQQGNTLRQARSRIDVPGLDRRLQAAVADDASVRAADPLATDDVASRTAASLQSQLDSAARMDEVTGRTEKRLTLLQAQLDESVTRAAELAASTGDLAALGSVGSDIDHLVEEMEALRQALEETGQLRPGAG